MLFLVIAGSFIFPLTQLMLKLMGRRASLSPGTFAVLAGLMLAGGVAIGLFMSSAFSLGGWLTGALLLLFAFIGRGVARREERAA